MFRVTKPTSAEIVHAVEGYSRLDLSASMLDPRRGLQVSELPTWFVQDISRSKIGKGPNAFEQAIRAFEQWRQFDLGWVRVGNIDAEIRVGQIVAVEVQALGLRSLNLSQIVSVTRETDVFGFIYKTTPHHAEEGEERFLLTYDPGTNEVRYELEAVSRPQHWLARLGYPVTRSFQHRFARESHQQMRDAVSENRQ